MQNFEKMTVALSCLSFRPHGKIRLQLEEFNAIWRLTNFSTIQGVSRFVDITAGGDFLGFYDQKSSHKHVSDFGRLWSYDRLKLRIQVEGNDY